MNNIDILEEKLKNIEKYYAHEYTWTDIDVEIVSNLIAENKELKEMIKRRIKYTNELEKYLFENCKNYVVPKSIIEKKIEELEKEKIECIIFKYSDIENYCNECKENCSYNDSINILQEILDERNNTDE